MLQLFRNFFQTKWGVGLTLALFAIIALAFGLGGVAGSGDFGGVAGGDRAAIVGNAKVGTAELSKEVSQDFDEARQQDPKLSMKAFLAGGGFEAAADQMFDRVAITVFGSQHGIIAGKRLVDSELAKIPALQGPDGKFSESHYRQLLAQRQMTDADVRYQIGAALVARQVLLPAQYGAAIPGEAVKRYAALLKEHRIGSVALLPSPAFAPKSPPNEAVLAAFYQHNRDAFTRPERRVIRYAIFDDSVIKQVPAPSDAEIAAYYNANAAQYAASESRTVTQLILPDEASAKAIAVAVAGGGSLDAAAKAKGLAASTLGPVTRDALAAQSAPEVAAAAFTAARGALVGPVKSAIGWYVLHVDAVEDKPARSLASAHGDIAALLATHKRQNALADLTAKIDDEFEKGGALSDAARELGVTLVQTDPLTADGQVYGKPGQTAPKDLAKVVPTAFTMDHEDEPQLAELVAGKTFIIFDVSQIAPSAPAPLAEIRPAVANAWAMQFGADAARAAALKVLGEVKHGTDLGKALAGLGVQLPPVQPLSKGRDEIAAMNGRVPPALSLFFGMAQGTTKLMAATGNRGWLVIQLKQIQTGSLAPNDPLLTQTAKELGARAGDEYAEELRLAIRNEVGVKRNEPAIQGVKSQLSGGN